MTSIVIFFIVTIALVWGVLIYNKLVHDRNTSLAAWSDIDVQLKRRHDLIPKLIDAVKQYASYESSLLESVTSLRSQAKAIKKISERENVERELQTQVHKLIAVAEDYPELKANQNFLELQKDISNVENDIQYARRYYNGAVRNINTRIDSFPDLVIARFLNYKYHEYFQLDD
ncbi:MAG: LemA family protein [Gammaproteobacteria bacterium]|nr:LemA family protein [Gammaproteobacteria bacterium]NNC66423.1 LemA family protein [Gammaproteobacteria bacterium]